MNGRSGAVDAESEVLAKIAKLPETDRVMAERIHAIIKASAPRLTPHTWYGMPGYAKDGKVVVFFLSAGRRSDGKSASTPSLWRARADR